MAKNINITEVSKGLVKRYLKKSYEDLAHSQEQIPGGVPLRSGGGYLADSQRKRPKGIRMAQNKMMGKSKVKLSEGTQETAALYDKMDKAQEQQTKKKEINPLFAKKRLKLKEHVEDLAEVSKALMGRYLLKASSSAKTHNRRAAAHHSSFMRTKDPKDAEYHSKNWKVSQDKADRRERGIDMVGRKLMKEEVEDIQELRNSTLWNYHQKAWKDPARRKNADLAMKKMTRMRYKETTSGPAGVKLKKAVNEETEINEVSKGLLKRYVQKAVPDAVARIHPKADSRNNWAKAFHRTKYIGKARKQMMDKEDK